MPRRRIACQGVVATTIKVALVVGTHRAPKVRLR
jgi:hypothetical protein